MIPKIIWQTHEWEYENLPDNFKKASMTWKNLNPTWEYRYSSAVERAKQVQEFSSELYKFYPFMNKVTQADVWRYIIVYTNGGIYSDMDSVCTASLESITDNIPGEVEILGPKANEDNILYNANFGAVKNSSCLKKVIDSITSEYQRIDLSSIIEVTKHGLSLLAATEFQLNNGLFWYSSTLKKNANLMWTEYDGFLHTGSIKEADWNPDYQVTYNGKTKSYLDLAKENNWSLM